MVPIKFLKCEKYAEDKDPKVLRTSYSRFIISSHRAICNGKRKRLLNMIIEIPILGKLLI